MTGIDIIWIVIFILFTFYRAAQKKSGQKPMTAQPWDQARRKTQKPKPVWHELIDAENLPGLPQFSEKKPDESKSPAKPTLAKTTPAAPMPAKNDRISSREESGCNASGGTKSDQNMFLCPQSIVQGIIMSEVLGPPAAKRGFRHSKN